MQNVARAHINSYWFLFINSVVNKILAGIAKWLLDFATVNACASKSNISAIDFICSDISKHLCFIFRACVSS